MQTRKIDAQELCKYDRLWYEWLGKDGMKDILVKSGQSNLKSVALEREETTLSLSLAS